MFNSTHRLDTHLNSGTPILKICILAQIVLWLFEISHFHTQNVFYFKGQIHIEHLSTEMNIPPAWDSLLLAKVSKITPPSNANSCYFFKLRVCVFGKAFQIQFNEFCLAVFWYHLLIVWPIIECKWNWYSMCL